MGSHKGCSIVLISFCCLYGVHSWNIWGVDLKIPTFNSYNPYCFAKECCNQDWIKFKKARLQKNITENVYGQPLLATAINALSSHFNPYFPPQKALTLSFHGMTGTGKNYVSTFIADSMFAKGTKSKYVHHFIGRMHFSENKYVEQYKANLYSWLKGNITNCPKQLFIFDEVDKMVPEVLNILKPMLDYIDNVDGVDYSQAVFIFLSNTGADIVNEHYLDLYLNEGKNREDLQMSDFEMFIQRGAFNEQGWLARGDGYLIDLTRKLLFSSVLGSFYHFVLKMGGFHHADAIKNNLIDHYIPFLPLEEKHIIKCIKKEFELRKVRNPKQEHIDKVMKFIEWGPDSTQSFSKTGCKRIGAKVALIVDKYYAHYSFEDKDEL